MRPEDPFDLRRDPVSPWERGLRPSDASDWLAGGSAVLCVLAVAWIAVRLYTSSEIPAKPVTTGTAHQAAAAALPSRPGGSAAAQNAERPGKLFKCIGPQRVAGYTDGACPVGSQAAPVTELPGLTVADGMTREDREAVRQANRIAAQQSVAHEVRVAQNVDRPNDECGRLSDAVAAYDAAARQPLPAWRQDELRALRKAARDRQFALRCS